MRNYIVRAALRSATCMTLFVTAQGHAQTTTSSTGAETPPQQTIPADNAPLPEGESSGSRQDIIVTGSRIARPELETIQPTQVIGAQQIQDRGYTNVIQALQSLPTFGPAGNSAVGAQSSFGPAQSFADFFGLGSQRTLTLVNGRRFVSSNTASIFGPVASGSQVDLNNIPTALVQRIDVVAIGGAPIYGSDAIAGTVNFILKRNYQGLELGAQYGISQKGDAPDRQASILAGTNFADDRGNITVAGQWNKTSGFTVRDRSVAAEGLFFGTPPASANSSFARLLYPAQRYSAFTSGGVPFSDDDFLITRSGIRDAAGNYLQFGPSGTLVPLSLGTRLRQGYISSGGNGFDLPATGNILTDSERYSATALANFEVSSSLRFFGEGWYSHSKGINIVDQPNYNTALFDAAGTADGNIPISINNPYLSAADRATIAASLPEGADTFYLGRANTDLTTGRSQATVEVYRFVGGLAGDFNVGEKKFSYEASVNYGHSRTAGRNLELVQQNFVNALDVVTNANGSISCRPGYTNATVETISSTCAPLNVLGSGLASQAAKDYIFAVARPISTSSQLVFNANTQGALFALPGGDVQVSLGYEHRREKTSFDPGAYYFGELQSDGTRNQYGRSIPIDPISGKFHTNEVFGELKVPIISEEMGISFLRTVEVDGAARYVKNSLSGGDLTWTAGGRLAFFKGLTFRGNFTRSIRSPAITEVFNPTSQAFDTANDPCDQRFVDSGPNPERRRANCIAGGIADPSNFVSNIVDFTSPVSVSGNPNLGNEKANSWTAGVVIQPSFLSGFTATVDWVDIKLKDAVVSPSSTDLMNACYDAADFPNTFCGTIDRDADGQVTFLREGYYNAASYRFKGLSTAISYVHTFDKVGTVGFDISYLYRDTLATKVGTGDLNNFAGEIGYPKHGFTGNLNYKTGAFVSQLQAVFVGRGRFDVDELDTTRDIKYVDDWVVFNATVGVDIDKDYSLRFIVNNVANRKPPYPYTRTYNATNVYYEGVVGRTFAISAKARF